MSVATQTSATGHGALVTYEVSDYVSVADAKDYVLVCHYRTSKNDNGQVVNEPILSSDELLKRMIGAFGGELQEAPHKIYGFFDDPERARYCAEAIYLYHRKQAVVNGTQLSISL